jgi:phosphohistidine phosphatase
MKQLLLLRHAQAESASSGLKDFERPLSERGRSEVIEAAACITRSGVTIDAALVSPARRTQETLDIIDSALHLTQILYEPALYLGEPQVLLRILQRCRAELRTVLLVGHNPGISELAQQLTADAHTVLRTAGLCSITLPQDSWRELAMASASAFSLLR